jgi:uncharacterized UPF0146 family protein
MEKLHAVIAVVLIVRGKHAVSGVGRRQRLAATVAHAIAAVVAMDIVAVVRRQSLLAERAVIAGKAALGAGIALG